MKLFVFLSIAALCAGAWVMHGAPGTTSASSALSRAAAVPARSSREQFAEALHKNASVREQLASRYPDTYRELAQMTKRDLKGCVVTQVLEGLLKADCR